LTLDQLYDQLRLDATIDIAELGLALRLSITNTASINLAHLVSLAGLAYSFSSTILDVALNSLNSSNSKASTIKSSIV